MQNSNIPSQISFLLYRTDNKKIAQQAKAYNQAINQNIKSPQDNVIFIEDPNHPEQFQIAVVINQNNHNQKDLINELHRD